MPDALRLHTMTHLRFYARSRLLLGLAVVLTLMSGIGSFGFIMMESSGDKLDMLRMVSWQVRSFAWFFTAAVGLFAFWWHTSHRSTIVVFTRPGRPETWLVSVFAAAISVAAAVHALGFLLTLGLSLAWHIPVQSGFLWLAIDGILESVIVVSVLTGLAAAFHPILALLVVMVFSEGMFYWLDLTLLGYLKAHDGAVFMRVLEWVVRGAHAVLPMLDPFARKTGNVEATLRVSGAEWLYLGGTAAYAGVVFGFWFAFAAYRLRRRPLR